MNKKVKIIIFIGLCLFLFIFIWFIFFIKPLFINVDLCMQKDTFKRVDNHIEETLGYDVYVVDKGITSAGYKGIGGHNKYLTIEIREENNVRVNVNVNEDMYNSINIGDYVHFERRVYYTNFGLRIKYVDNISNID